MEVLTQQSPDDEAPDAGFDGAYTGSQSASTGIMGMLEVSAVGNPRREGRDCGATVQSMCAESGSTRTVFALVAMRPKESNRVMKYPNASRNACSVYVGVPQVCRTLPLPSNILRACGSSHCSSPA